jgi:cytoskeletal protein CcmA (bactofilin family)
MWKREEPSQPVPPQITSKAGSDLSDGPSVNENVIIGKSIVVKGELRGSEDLTIEGQVEGKITLKQHVLTIGTHGRIRAQVIAKSVVVLGEVIGNIEATEKVAIRNDGTVEGDIKAPRVAIAEGAKFRGGIDMQQQAQPVNRSRSEPKAGGGEPGKPASPPARNNKSV